MANDVVQLRILALRISMDSTLKLHVLICRVLYQLTSVRVITDNYIKLMSLRS